MNLKEGIFGIDDKSIAKERAMAILEKFPLHFWVFFHSRDALQSNDVERM